MKHQSPPPPAPHAIIVIASVRLRSRGRDANRVRLLYELSILTVGTKQAATYRRSCQSTAVQKITALCRRGRSVSDGKAKVNLRACSMMRVPSVRDLDRKE